MSFLQKMCSSCSSYVPPVAALFSPVEANLNPVVAIPYMPRGGRSTFLFFYFSIDFFIIFYFFKNFLYFFIACKINAKCIELTDLAHLPLHTPCPPSLLNYYNPLYHVLFNIVLFLSYTCGFVGGNVKVYTR